MGSSPTSSPKRAASAATVWSPATTTRRASCSPNARAGPVRQTTAFGSYGARRRMPAQSASTRSPGASGPGSRGSGRMDGTAGTQLVASSPLARKDASCSASRPSTNLISQMPMPPAPAPAYAARSSSKLAGRVVNSQTAKGGSGAVTRAASGVGGVPGGLDLGALAEVRHHPGGEDLLRLDRLPVLEPARVDGDRDLRQALADVAHGLDALDHVLGCPDPDDVALDHLLVGRLGQLLEDPGRVEPIPGGLELVRGRQLVSLGERGGVPGQEALHALLRLAPGRIAVVVQVARVDPDDVGLGAVLGAPGAVEVELVLQGGVGQERRHDDRPPTLGGELVGAVAGPPEEDAEPATRPRDDVRVVDLVEVALEGEPLLLERREEDVEGLLVAVARLPERDARLQGDPAVAAQRAELVTAAEEVVGGSDVRGQDGGVVVREHVAERAKPDPLRPGRAQPPERKGVRRDGELREEEVLDHGIGVEAEPVGVDDLLHHLVVEPADGLPGPVLDLRVQAEPHRVTSCDRRAWGRSTLTDAL